ncbi:hypothetical protein SLE2022_130990 [Rubroshorea leprosula]
MSGVSGRVGRRMGMLLIPLELLYCISCTEFFRKKIIRAAAKKSRHRPSRCRFFGKRLRNLSSECSEDTCILWQGHNQRNNFDGTEHNWIFQCT